MFTKKERDALDSLYRYLLGDEYRREAATAWELAPKMRVKFRQLLRKEVERLKKRRGPWWEREGLLYPRDCVFESAAKAVDGLMPREWVERYKNLIWWAIPSLRSVLHDAVRYRNRKAMSWDNRVGGRHLPRKTLSEDCIKTARPSDYGEDI